MVRNSVKYICFVLMIYMKMIRTIFTYFFSFSNIKYENIHSL